MKKIMAAVGLAGASVLAIACSVDATGVGEDELVGERGDAISSWVCTDTNGIKQNLKYQYEAALAVAAIGEMGDLEVDLNFKLQNGSYGKLELTDTGKNKCAARGKSGCPSTSFILALQSMSESESGIPGWSGGNFQNILESHHKRYKDIASWTWTGCRGSDGKPLRMTAVPAGTTNDGVCSVYGVKDSINYWYKSSQPGKLWCKFAAFGGPYNGNASTPASGEGENPFMKYVTKPGTSQLHEGVDPVGGDMYGNPYPTVAGQSCGNTAATMGGFPYYPPTGGVVQQSQWIGACCYVNGQNGTYQKHTVPAYSNSHVRCIY